MSTVLRTLLEPGDEVVLTDPCFASHIQQVRLAGGNPVFWPLDRTNGWRLSPDDLPGLITSRTKAAVLVSPANPTGTAFAEAELQRLVRLVEQTGIILLVDDPYADFVYVWGEADRDFYHPARLGGLTDRIAYFYTFSKRHAMSGWRLGYVVLPDSLRSEALKVHDADLICAPRVSQVAGIAALEGGNAHIERFAGILETRGRLLCERLDRLPDLFEYTRPDGAYYVFPRVVAPHENARAFALQLLDEARVAVTPGDAFGPGGEHHVRMAFCIDDATINEAFDRIERWWTA